MLPADEAAAEGEEGFVDVVAAVGADQESATAVEPGEGALDDPALLSPSVGGTLASRAFSNANKNG